MSQAEQLRVFLTERPDPAAVQFDPPPLIPRLANLPPQTYIDAALNYVNDYAFDQRSFKSQARKYAPDPKWRERARKYLRACISVDRSDLAAIADPTGPPYDAAQEQQRFIHEVVFKQRWELENVAAEILELVDLVRQEVRAADGVHTPGRSIFYWDSTKSEEKEALIEKVKIRDGNKCRMSATQRLPMRKPPTAEDMKRFRVEGTMTATLELVHGLPYAAKPRAFAFLTALTGIRCDDLTADCVENAFLCRVDTLHYLFSRFELYLECRGGDHDLVVRSRGDVSLLLLGSFISARDGHCQFGTTLLDRPLCPPHDASIPDIDPKFFVLHKFIGDIVWMCDGPPDDEYEEKEEEIEKTRVLSDDNFDELVEKLSSPMMGYLARDGGVFGRVMVPKDDVDQGPFGRLLLDSVELSRPTNF
ncbi:hypothetical protein B0H16DRAFT_1474656 [Mycena metata]|uniref:Uncharacterized protein n=1 Tax=Mycena metata TaxID=1033252 RepID=A0AAD7MJB0_9AGAR|nr:hypothetical protein B0H16DRAFT_1474656 [Mycena metata]